jgi:hypothetical protein
MKLRSGPNMKAVSNGLPAFTLGLLPDSGHTAQPTYASQAE